MKFRKVIILQAALVASAACSALDKLVNVISVFEVPNP
jgi:hypothetical protein